LLPMALVGWHFAWPLAVALVLLLSVVLGWIHAWFITRLGLQPFIVTLCGLLLYRGIARFISHDETKGFGNARGFESLKSLATAVWKPFGEQSSFGIPMPFIILLIIAAIMWVVLHRSIFG